MRQFLLMSTILAMVSLGMLAGCDQTQNVASSAGASGDGNAKHSEVKIRAIFEKPGVLGRVFSGKHARVQLRLKSVDDLNMPDEYIEYQGVNDTVHYACYLASMMDWKLTVKVFDENDSLTHQAEQIITVVPGQGIGVELHLAARHSMLRMAIPVRDSFERVLLKVNNRILIDSVLSWSSDRPDTFFVQHDYVPASDTREQWLRLEITGRKFGISSLHYRKDTALMVVPGESQKLPLVLDWVGPQTPPDVRLDAVAVIGTTGTIDFDISYEPESWYGNYDSSFIDRRDGERYRYRRFGNQIWMTQNLRYLCQGCDTLGHLYSWYFYEETEQPSWCPDGWHLPDTSEWQELIRFARRGDSLEYGLARLRRPGGWYHVEQDCHPRTGDCIPAYTFYPGNDSLGFSIVASDDDGWALDGWSESYSFAGFWTSTPGAFLLGVTWSAAYFKNSAIEYIGEMPRARIRCIMDR